MSKTDDAIRNGEIDPTQDRPMPPTDHFTGRVYHGIPDSYPFNKEGFVESQAEDARTVTYRGVSDGSEWRLADGAKLEIWPDGAVFNEDGSLCGWFEPRVPEGYRG